jgi:surface antigen
MTDRVYTPARRFLPLLLIVAVFGLSGCAMSTSLGPMFAADDITGSITPRDGRFSPSMSDEDWRLAKAAIDTATAMPAPTASTTWDNPQSGLKGAVTPVAAPYAAQDRACRAFIATVVLKDRTDWYQGRACRGKADFTVLGVTTFAPPAS